MPNRHKLKKRRKYAKNNRKKHQKRNTNDSDISQSLYVSSDHPQYMLVAGYIRGIESMIKTHVIPNDVMNLCYSFYFVAKGKLLFIKYSYSTYKKKMNDFGIINIDKNINPGCVSKLITHTSSYNRIKYQCFIPNLSTLVKQYKGYNGIIITSSTRQYDGFFTVIEKHPTFLLFESKYVCNNSSHDYMTMLMSTKRIVATKHASLIYCGKTHGIIYGNHKNLYQLKLENVHINNFNFTEIRQNKTNSFANIWYHKWNMHYSNLCDQIFGIQMRKEYSVNWNCSTFDLCSNEWHNIKPFTMKNRSRKRRDFDCIICNDGPNKLIYVVTNFEYVGKYDYNKNYWTKVYSQDTEIGNHFSTFRDQQEYWRSEKNNRPIIWIKDYQPMILYRAQSSYTSKSDGSIISVTCLDMRCNNNNKQWTLLNKVSTEECAAPIQCI